jgi:hypothetical protein
MKKVLIIGAGGSLAASVIEQLQVKKDVQLTLYLRNPQQLTSTQTRNAIIAQGDVMDQMETLAIKAGVDTRGGWENPMN